MPIPPKMMTTITPTAIHIIFVSLRAAASSLVSDWFWFAIDFSWKVTSESAMGAISLYQAHDCPITPRKKETNGSAGTGAQILVKTDHRGSSQGGYGKFIRYKRA